MKREQDRKEGRTSPERRENSGRLISGQLGLHRGFGLQWRLRRRRGGAILVGLHAVLVLVLAEGLHHDGAECARGRDRLHRRRDRERPGLDPGLVRRVRGVLVKQ